MAYPIPNAGPYVQTPANNFWGVGPNFGATLPDLFQPKRDPAEAAYVAQLEGRPPQQPPSLDELNPQLMQLASMTGDPMGTIELAKKIKQDRESHELLKELAPIDPTAKDYPSQLTKLLGKYTYGALSPNVDRILNLKSLTARHAADTKYDEPAANLAKQFLQISETDPEFDIKTQKLLDEADPNVLSHPRMASLIERAKHYAAQAALRREGSADTKYDEPAAKLAKQFLQISETDPEFDTKVQKLLDEADPNVLSHPRMVSQIERAKHYAAQAALRREGRKQEDVALTRELRKFGLNPDDFKGDPEAANLKLEDLKSSALEQQHFRDALKDIHTIDKDEGKAVMNAISSIGRPISDMEKINSWTQRNPGKIRPSSDKEWSEAWQLARADREEALRNAETQLALRGVSLRGVLKPQDVAEPVKAEPQQIKAATPIQTLGEIAAAKAKAEEAAKQQDIWKQWDTGAGELENKILQSGFVDQNTLLPFYASLVKGETIPGTKSMERGELGMSSIDTHVAVLRQIGIDPGATAFTLSDGTKVSNLQALREQAKARIRDAGGFQTAQIPPDVKVKQIK